MISPQQHNKLMKEYEKRGRIGLQRGESRDGPQDGIEVRRRVHRGRWSRGRTGGWRTHEGFTDPPYGLVKNVNDSSKEIPYQGVYRVSPNDGKVTLLTSEVTRPNGIAFSPDEKTLYVASSYRKKAIWMAYPVKADGTLNQGRVLLDTTSMVKTKKGLPERTEGGQTRQSLGDRPRRRVDYFSARQAPRNARHRRNRPPTVVGATTALTLYITADMYLCRVKTKVKGAGF